MPSSVPRLWMRLNRQMVWAVPPTSQSRSRVRGQPGRLQSRTVARAAPLRLSLIIITAAHVSTHVNITGISVSPRQ